MPSWSRHALTRVMVPPTSNPMHCPSLSRCLLSCNSHRPSDHTQDMADARLAEVCAPKAAGAAAFAVAHLPLVTQTLFSSTSAVWSQPAAGHYAAANCVADGFGAAARAAGLPATSAQFGPFGGTGMAAAHVAELAAIGMPALDPVEACHSQSVYHCVFLQNMQWKLHLVPFGSFGMAAVHMAELVEVMLPVACAHLECACRCSATGRPSHASLHEHPPCRQGWASHDLPQVAGLDVWQASMVVRAAVITLLNWQTTKCEQMKDHILALLRALI